MQATTTTTEMRAVPAHPLPHPALPTAPLQRPQEVLQLRAPTGLLGACAGAEGSAGRRRHRDGQRGRKPLWTSASTSVSCTSVSCTDQLHLKVMFQLMKVCATGRWSSPGVQMLASLLSSPVSARTHWTAWGLCWSREWRRASQRSCCAVAAPRPVRACSLLIQPAASGRMVVCCKHQV